MFKLLIVVAALLAAAVAIDRHSYGGHSEGLSYGSSEDAHAEIKSLYTGRDQKGFDYGYETTNHIKADASGDEHGNIHGNFEWVSPEGVHVAVKYEADENGYRPVSDAIPTPPPIPPAILKALEYIRTHPPYEEKEQRYGH